LPEAGVAGLEFACPGIISNARRQTRIRKSFGLRIVEVPASAPLIDWLLAIEVLSSWFLKSVGSCLRWTYGLGQLQEDKATNIFLVRLAAILRAG